MYYAKIELGNDCDIDVQEDSPYKIHCVYWEIFTSDTIGWCSII